MNGKTDCCKGIAGIKDEKTHRKKRGFRVSSPKTALSLQLDKVFIPV